MRFMNDYDLHMAIRRFSSITTPNRLALAIVVDRLRKWADENSDGWAHWALPAKVASTAMGHIESRTSRENDEQEATDITDDEMQAAVRPIKSFLTRQKVDPEQADRILSVANR